jgi:shikimate kinase
VSVWLKAELDVLVDRVGRRSYGPLLKADGLRKTSAWLMALRYSVSSWPTSLLPTGEVKRKVTAADGDCSPVWRMPWQTMR